MQPSEAQGKSPMAIRYNHFGFDPHKHKMENSYKSKGITEALIPSGIGEIPWRSSPVVLSTWRAVNSFIPVKPKLGFQACLFERFHKTSDKHSFAYWCPRSVEQDHRLVIHYLIDSFKNSWRALIHERFENEKKANTMDNYCNVWMLKHS